MKISLTLYPRFEEPIELIIQCVPDLNGKEVEGYWDIDTNYVALSWRLYSEFNKIELQSEKKEFFSKLKKITRKSIIKSII
jgi:hypothetical protein